MKDLAEDLYDGQVLQKLFGKTLNILFDVTLTMMLKQAWYVVLSLCEFTRLWKQVCVGRHLSGMS